ncbi:MAG: hypothetical protein LUD50_06825 [Clostridia bacterium]|nr:hypothetical protein [Clostridia bacterium]
MISEKEFQTLLSCYIVPGVIDNIVSREGISFKQAVHEFYRSKTYKYLEIEDTKVWHFSAYCLYTIWKSEQETGEPDWPEVGFLA